MCEHGELEWVSWKIRTCNGKVYVDAVNQTGRRDAFIAFTADEFEAFAAAANRALNALRQPA
jgi:hypothetical protein